MVPFKLILVIVLAVFSGCACVPQNPTTSPSSSETPKPYAFDREKARELSDAVVAALIKNDRSALRSKMEKAARDYYNQTSFDKIIDQMFEAYGSPKEAIFMKVEEGRKQGAGGYDKPVLKHWYAVRTSKYDYGSHFVFVEIVPDEDGYASSGVSIVNFPMGVPQDMQ